MTLATILAILQWTLPLAKAALAAVTKANAPQELIDALQGAVNGLQAVSAITEPTRAQVLALDIDPAAWGPAPKPVDTTGRPPVVGA